MKKIKELENDLLAVKKERLTLILQQQFSGVDNTERIRVLELQGNDLLAQISDLKKDKCQYFVSFNYTTGDSYYRNLFQTTHFSDYDSDINTRKDNAIESAVFQELRIEIIEKYIQDYMESISNLEIIRISYN